MVDKLEGIYATSGQRHKFDIITDICERCSLQRKMNADLFRFGRFNREYLVGGKWVKDAPACIPREVDIEARRKYARDYMRLKRNKDTKHDKG